MTESGSEGSSEPTHVRLQMFQPVDLFLQFFRSRGGHGGHAFSEDDRVDCATAI